MSNVVAFPMRDPYGPAVNARIPVPGLTRFPGRYNVMPAAFYGLDAPVVVNGETATLVNGETTSEPSGFAGFADSGFGLVDTWSGGGGVGLPPTSSGDSTGNDGGGGGIDWGAIINAGIHSAPAIIQAAEGGGAPYNYYQQGVQLPQQQQQGQVYRDAYGNIINPQSAYQAAGGLGVGVAQIGNSLSSFVAQNPLLVLGGLAAVVLLMTRPPGRR